MILDKNFTVCVQANGITCMSIGTGSSMCAELAEACKGYVTSLVLSNDVVPRLSYHTVEYLLDELIRKSPALNFAESVRSSVALTFAPFTTAGRAAAANAAATAAAAAAGGPVSSSGTTVAGNNADAIQLAEMPSAEGLSALNLGGGRSTARSASAPGTAGGGVSGGFSGAIAASRTASSPRNPPEATTNPTNTTPRSSEFELSVSTGAPLEVGFRGAIPADFTSMTTGVENAARTAGEAGVAGVFPSEEISPYLSSSGEISVKDPSKSWDAESINAGTLPMAVEAQQVSTSAGKSDTAGESGDVPSIVDEMDRLWAGVRFPPCMARSNNTICTWLTLLFLYLVDTVYAPEA